MVINAEDIRAFLEESLAGTDLYVVDVSVSDSPVKPKVTIKADRDEGISIDECATLSRRLARKIEEAYGTEISYVLEVTSPGVDFPLTSPRQYKRNIGRKLRLFLKDGSEKTGTLEEVTENGIKVTEDVKGKNKKAAPVPAPTPTEVTFEEIEKTNIIISFK
jgi:ribosome maturation factor RimP